jgi:hypothetical protein
MQILHVAVAVGVEYSNYSNDGQNGMAILPRPANRKRNTSCLKLA